MLTARAVFVVEARVVVFLADFARDGVFLAFTGSTWTAPSAPFEATALFLLVVVRFLPIEPTPATLGSAIDDGEAVFRRDERTEETPFCCGFSSAAR